MLIMTIESKRTQVGYEVGFWKNKKAENPRVYQPFSGAAGGI